MKDYSKGKIYAIRSHKTDLIYIGSTVQPLYKRLSVHKTNYNYYIRTGIITTYSYKIFELDASPYIELIINYPCSCLDELRKEERKYIRSLECVNKNIPGRTMEEYKEWEKAYYKKWREDNIDKIKTYRKKWRNKNKEYYKKYYEDNKDALQAYARQKIACPCGGDYTRSHKTQHEKTYKHQQFIKSQ